MKNVWIPNNEIFIWIWKLVRNDIQNINAHEQVNFWLHMLTNLTERIAWDKNPNVYSYCICILGKERNHPRRSVSFFCCRDYSNASRHYHQWKMVWTKWWWRRQVQYKSLMRKSDEKRKERTLLFLKQGWLWWQNVLSPSMSTSSILGPGSHFPYRNTMMWKEKLERPMNQWVHWKNSVEITNSICNPSKGSFRRYHATCSSGVVKDGPFASPCSTNLVCSCNVALE